MRKTLTIAVLMLALTASVAAAEKGEFLMGGLVGASVPTGDLGDIADPGFAAGVYGDYMFTESVALGVDAVYHGFGTPDEIVDALDADDVTFSVIQFTGHLRWFFPTQGTVLPFIHAGGGIYNGSTKVEGGPFESDESESKGGFFGGAGLDYKMGSMWRIGAEANYHYVLDAAIDDEGDETAATIFGINGRISFSFAAQTQ